MAEAASQPPCAKCGGPHHFDVSIPSEAWNRVARASGLQDYLCLSCIVLAFQRMGEDFSAKLWSDELDGVEMEVRFKR